MKRLVGFLIILILASGYKDGSSAEFHINRGVSGIQLGMTLQEVRKVFPTEEKEDGVISLMRKFGFGEPEKQAELNRKLGKQVYYIKGNLPDGASSIELFFRNTILYQIALHYGKDYVQKVDWDLFTLPTIKKYGQPILLNDILTTSSFSYQWKDAQTRLEISKGGDLSGDKNRFAITIYNVFYTDIKTHIAMQEDEKNEMDKQRIVPKF